VLVPLLLPRGLRRLVLSGGVSPEAGVGALNLIVSSGSLYAGFAPRRKDTTRSLGERCVGWALSSTSAATTTSPTVATTAAALTYADTRLVRQ
jgi:hypothetical protein